MNNSTILKLDFWRSYWETANTFDEADRRLKFIEAILNLGFANTEPDFGTDKELARVFIQTKANVLADTRRKKGGAPEGNQNARKNNPKTTSCFNQKTNNDKENVNVEEKEEDDESLSQSQNSSSKKFIKPTVEEIRAYCEERNNSVDAENFFNFYESKGWLVGKNKMKDWKASVRTWEKKNQSNQTEKIEFWN